MHSATLKSRSGQSLVGATLGGVILGVAALAMLSGHSIFWRVNQQITSESGSRSLSLLLMQLGVDNGLCTRNLGGLQFTATSSHNLSQLQFGSLRLAPNTRIFGVDIQSMTLSPAMPGAGGGGGNANDSTVPVVSWSAGIQLAEVRVMFRAAQSGQAARDYVQSVLVPLEVLQSGRVYQSTICRLPIPSGGGGGGNVAMSQACAEIGGTWLDPAINSIPPACAADPSTNGCPVNIQREGCDLINGFCQRVGARVSRVHPTNSSCNGTTDCEGGFAMECEEDSLNRAILAPTIGSGGCARDEFVKSIRMDGTLDCSPRGTPAARSVSCATPGTCYRFNLVRTTCTTARFDRFINGVYDGYVCDRPAGALCGSDTCP